MKTRLDDQSNIIITLIESRYKTIHSIMYKIKDKEQKKKNENSTSTYMNRAESRLNSSSMT